MWHGGPSAAREGRPKPLRDAFWMRNGRFGAAEAPTCQMGGAAESPPRMKGRRRALRDMRGGRAGGKQDGGRPYATRTSASMTRREGSLASPGRGAAPSKCRAAAASTRNRRPALVAIPSPSAIERLRVCRCGRKDLTQKRCAFLPASREDLALGPRERRDGDAPKVSEMRWGAPDAWDLGHVAYFAT